MVIRSAAGKPLFGDVIQRKRYFYAMLMILLMIGVAEWLGEKEIIFPEMAALTIGMWIVDKRVWQVRRLLVVVLMTLGAAAGVCIAEKNRSKFILAPTGRTMETGCRSRCSGWWAAWRLWPRCSLCCPLRCSISRRWVWLFRLFR